MKEVFVEPEVMVIELEAADVICTSGFDCDFEVR